MAKWSRREGQVDPKTGKVVENHKHRGEKPPPPPKWTRGTTENNTKPPPPEQREGR